MNERIGQLAEQAGLLGPSSRVGKSHEATEKFAELIVRECLDIASEVRGPNRGEPATDTHYVIGYDRACEKMIDGIKQHFGVEL